MANKVEKERQKLIQEKSQQILSELLKDEDNKYCVDCDAKGDYLFLINQLACIALHPSCFIKETF